MSENIIIKVTTEIDDTEVLVGWLLDGTDREDWTACSAQDDGSVIVNGADGVQFNLAMSEFLKCEGIIGIDYIGNDTYKVSVVK